MSLIGDAYSRAPTIATPSDDRHQLFEYQNAKRRSTSRNEQSVPEVVPKPSWVCPGIIARLANSVFIIGQHGRAGLDCNVGRKLILSLVYFLVELVLSTLPLTSDQFELYIHGYWSQVEPNQKLLDKR